MKSTNLEKLGINISLENDTQEKLIKIINTKIDEMILNSISGKAEREETGLELLVINTLLGTMFSNPYESREIILGNNRLISWNRNDERFELDF